MLPPAEKIWSYQLQNKQYYIDEFKNKLTFNIYSQDRTWYKDRFQYRVSFVFGDNKRRASSSNGDWRAMLYHFIEKGWKFRCRTEGYHVLFTSQTEILDAILANPDWLGKIVEFGYSNTRYLTEFANYKGIDAITDIKFLKRVPEHCYQVTLGNFNWRVDDNIRLTVTQYLATNQSDFIFKGSEKRLIEDSVKHNSSRLIYGGFRFYAKNTDDIIMIHMMAPGKVVEIIKIMERKVEEITS